MLFVGCFKRFDFGVLSASSCKRGDKRSFSNSACSDDCNEFDHGWNYKILQQFDLPSKSCWSIKMEDVPKV